MKPSNIQQRAVSQALARLLELDGKTFHEAGSPVTWRVDNREVIRLLRLAFPGVEARGEGRAYCPKTETRR
jgi:hypothetical protein